MADAEYHYHYFRDPHRFAFYSPEPKPCGIYGLERPGYDGPFYGEEDIDFICEPCLAGGRLAEKGLTTNEATSLSEDLAQLLPQAFPEQIADLTARRTRELEQRTPYVPTWQPLVWPVHCGDFCCYVGEVGQPDLNELASADDGKAFFMAHLSERYSKDEEYVQDLWTNIRPDSATNSPLTWSLTAYLFQCLHCGTHIIEWDCD